MQSVRRSKIVTVACLWWGAAKPLSAGKGPDFQDTLVPVISKPGLAHIKSVLGYFRSIRERPRGVFCSKEGCCIHGAGVTVESWIGYGR